MYLQFLLVFPEFSLSGDRCGPGKRTIEVYQYLYRGKGTNAMDGLSILNTALEKSLSGEYEEVRGSL